LTLDPSSLIEEYLDLESSACPMTECPLDHDGLRDGGVANEICPICEGPLDEDPLAEALAREFGDRAEIVRRNLEEWSRRWRYDLVTPTLFGKKKLFGGGGSHYPTSSR
jgi:hypothetical protein